MQSYQQFIFESYHLNPTERTISLVYSFDGKQSFTETIALPDGEWVEGILDSPALHNALFALHIIGGVSYYKAALCPTIVVKSGKLTKDQAHFWDTVYLNGLGELLYRNKLNPDRVAHFPVSSPDAPESSTSIVKKGKFLVPFGGGKDSIVTLELLRKARVAQTLYRNGAHPFITEALEVTGLPSIQTERKLDPALFELNKEGAINGHVPITTYLSFLTVVVGLLYGFEGVVWSNERSANFGNVSLFGKQINHQWSKSQEAEQAIRSYIAKYIAADFQYLNMLRPYSELKIAQIFTSFPQYFLTTTSCNRNWKISSATAHQHWCGECAKCAFSFLLFSAFLPLEKVTEIFGKNLFEDSSLLALYKELAGLEGIKPFDCVGTPEEVIAAFKLASKQDAVRETVLWKKLQPVLDTYPYTEDWQNLEYPADFPALTKEWLSYAS